MPRVLQPLRRVVRSILLTLVMLGAASPGFSQTAASTLVAGARSHVYKAVDDVQLALHIVVGEGEAPRPAIVFFFGGGWRSGSPTQFSPHARYLSSRGVTVALADYRVSSRHGTTPVESTRDAKSAVRWLRENSRELGVDPDRIAAGGGSAGGHLAAATAVVPGLDEPGENLEVSSEPNALLLFNPALDLARLAPRFGLTPESAVSISPQQHVRPGLPPTIIFHGTGDTTVPHASAVAFRDAMVKASNSVELVSYDGRPHGFFNYGRSGGPAAENEDFLHSLERVDRFLEALGFVHGEPGLGSFEFKQP